MAYSWVKPFVVASLSMGKCLRRYYKMEWQADGVSYVSGSNAREGPPYLGS